MRLCFYTYCEHHWTNGANDMVMGCANKYIFELMEWIYIRYFCLDLFSTLPIILLHFCHQYWVLLLSNTSIYIVIIIILIYLSLWYFILHCIWFNLNILSSCKFQVLSTYYNGLGFILNVLSLIYCASVFYTYCDGD